MLGAQHPVEPYRQLASSGHLGNGTMFSVAAVEIFFAKGWIKPYSGLRGLHP